MKATLPEKVLETMLAYVAQHPHPEMARFKQALSNWGDKTVEVPATQLPGVRHLHGMLANPSEATHALTELIVSSRKSWRGGKAVTK